MSENANTSVSNLQNAVEEIITPTANGRLTRRESRTLEFKEQFNFAALADYFRDFAAFANNVGGLLVFGVTDSPRTPAGLSQKSLNSFETLDAEKITGFLNDCFSCEIAWEAVCFQKDAKSFAAFSVEIANEKPVICTKDEGKDQVLKNGAIYYRYGGRTQVVRAPELQAIINSRIEQTNAAWIEHVQQVGVAGPNKAVLLNEAELAATDAGSRFVVDRDLAARIKFVKEGHLKKMQVRKRCD
ncbi:ATP-binding protein [uncultured Roseobacter sp.]|uniref:AlbA family DNA-binding domain-containing protein n=1 Tax=uncultured Roseobacter sp. TaxID=114847 RepID=UPI00262CE267|nr:ATP-binding protein [uncultured Roseobacter sp.]